MKARCLHPVATKLRARRKILGLTQAQVAARAGYSHRTIKNWEQGWGVPTMRALLDWCEALDVDLTLTMKEPSK